jgi:hypothetical protein
MWVVTSGPYAWTVLRNGMVVPRETRFPFVAENTETRVETTGPRALLVYGRGPDELQQQLYGLFLGVARGRAVRH